MLPPTKMPLIKTCVSGNVIIIVNFMLLIWKEHEGGKAN